MSSSAQPRIRGLPVFSAPFAERGGRAGWNAPSVPVWIAALALVLGFAGTGYGEGPRDAKPDSTDSVHWSFRPVRKPSPPRVEDETQVRNDIDRFLQSRLEAEGLRPVEPAAKEAWLRRVALDLTGLPPTPEEQDAFLSDATPEAHARVVERLLASPRYGERWGRHWMDVVRYADTAGDNADYPVPEAYRYRDYIVAAFDSDKPYDRFVREQIAGDLLAESGETPKPEGIVATGFLALSRRYGTGPYELWHLTLENTIDTVGQAFLGLNLRCARCHDHKSDPVTMGDYYGLYGIFESTEFPWAGSEEIQSKQFDRRKFVPLEFGPVAAAKWAAWEERKRALREEIAALEKPSSAGDDVDAKGRAKRLEDAKRRLRTVEKPGAPDDLAVAYAVGEGKPGDAALQKRGEPTTPGPIVRRCVPAFLAGDAGFRVAEGASGRLEFARWLTRPEHPLTARVMVNRIWQHHFGTGLVPTPNNFGTRGEPPVHRELLDYLAARFVESGWSTKAMHRLILESAAYRRSSEDGASQRASDPGNRFLWRFERRRLDAETLRDAVLWVAGRLDTNRPGMHPFPPPEKWTWTQHTPFKELYETRHRSVYLMTQRLQRHPFLALFDGPDTNNSTESRRSSIVPQQALFAMNHPWVDEHAAHLAGRVRDLPGDDRAKIRELLRRAWGRSPSAEESLRWVGWLTKARAAVAEAEGAAGDSAGRAWTTLCRVALNANEFLYVD